MTARRLALFACAAAALTLGACASKPKPAPGLAETGPSAAAEPQTALPPDGAIGAPASSQAELARAAGDLVFFGFDSHVLEADARAVLTRQAAWLGERGTVSAIVAGSADERGTREYNLALGARRAAAARDFLVSQGVDASRLRTISYGKEKPLDPASNEDAWAKNRNAHTLVGDLP